MDSPVFAVVRQPAINAMSMSPWKVLGRKEDQPYWRGKVMLKLVHQVTTSVDRVDVTQEKEKQVEWSARDIA